MKVLEMRRSNGLPETNQRLGGGWIKSRTLNSRNDYQEGVVTLLIRMRQLMSSRLKSTLDATRRTSETSLHALVAHIPTKNSSTDWVSHMIRISWMPRIFYSLEPLVSCALSYHNLPLLLLKFNQLHSISSSFPQHFELEQNISHLHCPTLP